VVAVTGPRPNGSQGSQDATCGVLSLGTDRPTIDRPGSHLGDVRTREGMTRREVDREG
jgi:hypothetical protein